jgi:hypothetical protein
MIRQLKEAQTALSVDLWTKGAWRGRQNADGSNGGSCRGPLVVCCFVLVHIDSLSVQSVWAVRPRSLAKELGEALKVAREKLKDERTAGLCRLSPDFHSWPRVCSQRLKLKNDIMLSSLQTLLSLQPAPLQHGAGGERV